MIPRHHAWYSERNLVQHLGARPIAVDLVIFTSDKVSLHSIFATEKLTREFRLKVVAINANCGDKVIHELNSKEHPPHPPPLAAGGTNKAKQILIELREIIARNK